MKSKVLSPKITKLIICIGILQLTANCGKHDSSGLASASFNIGEVTGGTWAKQMVLASESSAAGIKSSGKIARLLLVKATKNGDLLNTTEELCDISSTGSKSTKLTFPDAFKRSLPQTTRSYKLTNDSGKLLLQSPTLIEVIGAKLNDPSKDELPSRASDPRVYDQDGDQQPGSTVEISASAFLVSLSGKVYLTQRTVIEESGILTSADRIDGKITWTIEQHVLGSDSTVLGAVSPKITPDLDQSTFSMRKLANTATCETVISTMNDGH